MKLQKCLPYILSIFLASATSSLFGIVVDFEDQPSFTPVTNQYSPEGVRFNNILVVGSLPSFPASSGTQIAYQANDWTLIAEAVGMTWTSAGAFITANFQSTFSAYDALDNPIASISIPSNFGVGAYFELSGSNISYVTLSPDIKEAVTLATTAIDDFTFTPTPTENNSASVPDTGSTAMLATIGLLGLAFCKRRSMTVAA